MLPLHAGSAILLSMCTFCIGYGLGWLHRPRKTDIHVVRVPGDQPGVVVEFKTPTKEP